ncbi:type II toxin-antitoxin system HicA family toxin [Peptoniphilus harei]|nr:type II toxin-antitoxin system HicA family toxin [Peptoniphilus harei]
MAKTKPYRKVVKILKDNGWVHTRTDGSYEIYVKDGKACPVKCNKKDIPSGTLTSIERITGLKF